MMLEMLPKERNGKNSIYNKFAEEEISTPKMFKILSELKDMFLILAKSSDDDGGFEHSPRIIGIVMLCRERWRERENATKQEQGDNKYFSFLTFDPPSNILSSFHRKYLANPLSSSHVEAAAVVRESFTKLKQ